MLVIPLSFEDDGGRQTSFAIFKDRVAKMNDYLTEVSYGKISLKADVFENWVNLTSKMSHYGKDLVYAGDDKGGNGRGSLQLAYDVVEQVDDSVDFSRYSYLMLVHAGEDQAEATPNILNDRIWSHSYWGISIPTRDGVSVTRFSVVSERSALGVWVHEYLHQLGELPDLLDTVGGKDHYVGVWSPMDIGLNLGVPRGSSPPHPTSWEKMMMGWLAPVTLPLNDLTVTIAPLEEAYGDFNRAAMLTLPDGTYYIIEAREKVGFDLHLPGEGVLIYHVDERGDVPKIRIMPRESEDTLKSRAAYRVGDSFYDEFHNLYIEVSSKSFHGYEVQISVNRPRDLLIEMSSTVSILQPLSMKITVSKPTVKPKLNLFVDDKLYKTSSDLVDGKYSTDIWFNRAGDHVVRVIVVDPVQRTRFEAAKHVYAETPYTLLIATAVLTLLTTAALIVLAFYRRRYSGR